MTLILGGGLFWQVYNNRPILIIDVEPSDNAPFFQEFILQNTGNRSAILSGIYIMELKLNSDTINWNSSKTRIGPILKSVDFKLKPSQKLKFSLISFRPNIPKFLVQAKFNRGAFTIDTSYYDSYKLKPSYFKNDIYFELYNGRWQEIGLYLKNNIGI